MCFHRAPPTPGGYAEWLGRYLGPKLRAAHPDVKILVWDYNRLADVVTFVSFPVEWG